MQTMRSGREAVPTSDMRYKLKLSMLPSYFLGSIPGFKKKTAPAKELSQRSDSDGQRKTMSHLEGNYGHGTAKGGGGMPPLLPSVSDSKLGKAKQSGSSGRIRKILVSNPNTAATKSYEVKVTSIDKPYNGGSSPQKILDSPDLKHLSGSRSRPKLNPDHSGASTASSSGSGQEHSPNEFYHHNSSRSKSSSTAQNILYGNTRSSAEGSVNNNYSSSLATPPSSSRAQDKQASSKSPRASSGILSSLGFGSGGSHAKAAITVIPVRSHDSQHPHPHLGHTNSATSSTSNIGAAHARVDSSSASHCHAAAAVVHTGGTTTTTSYGHSKAQGVAKAGSASILPTLPSGAPAASSSGAAVATAAGGKAKVPCCDKCDGKHETDACPYYKKKREDHPDAQRNGKQMGGVSSLPGNTLYTARVVRQPGDGSCLFHSMSYGLPGRSNAATLRSEICQFIVNNPDLKISDTPLQDWVRWDSNSSVTEYARRMSRGSWGGGIEMACLSQMKDVNVHVYERSGIGLKRISAFDRPLSPETKPVVRVLYCGGVHYDAIVV